MIGYLRGILKETQSDRCIIDVQGIGYVVYCSKNTLSQLSATSVSATSANDTGEVLLHTRLIHREDTLDLYGFLHGEERLLFDMLITVSGIGPKQAIKILGASKVSDIVHAVVHEDSGFLMQLSGIGKKKSQQIILELKEKLKESFEVTARAGVSAYTEAVSALEALGFTRGESKQAVEKALELHPQLADVGKIVELALKNLS
ncbi:MAG: Holliday junction branch migration protein RuvA [Spirochaetes bacterium]|nr:Holliday junction branch migration protein RuvA [Spirochaetota bacterium]